MFGGCASSAWNSSGNWINDRNPFLFSLRRGGVSYKEKFTVKNSVQALFGYASFGPTFGGGHDIHICDQSNTNIGSNSNFGHSFNLSNGYTYRWNAREFLAGNYDKWITTEIEVYQII